MRRGSQLNMKRLVACASRDVTRFHLNAGHFSEDGKHWVSTDGHRMFVVQADGIDMPGAVPGRTYEAADLAKGQFAGIDCKYPNWKQLVPDIGRAGQTIFEWTIPDWFKDLRGKRGMVKMGFNRVVSESPEIPDTCRLAFHDLYIGFNARYFAEFASESVWVYIKSPLEPILITPIRDAINDAPWFAVIMPLRV